MGHVHHPGEVDGQDRLPLLRLGLDERGEPQPRPAERADPAARVVHEDVDRAGPFDHRGDRLGIAHVRDDRVRLPAVVLDLADDALRALDVEVVDPHLAAGTRQLIAIARPIPAPEPVTTRRAAADQVRPVTLHFPLRPP